jgi:hypothetical protein
MALQNANDIWPKQSSDVLCCDVQNNGIVRFNPQALTSITIALHVRNAAINTEASFEQVCFLIAKLVPSSFEIAAVTVFSPIFLEVEHGRLRRPKIVEVAIIKRLAIKLGAGC